MSETQTDEHGRTEPPVDGDEAATLLGFLRYQRETLAWKTSGLDADQLARSLPPTSMTLGGMLKHLAYVEDDWFQRWTLDRAHPEPWASVDWKADPDWEWHSAAGDDPEALRALWRAATSRSDEAIATALADGGLGRPAERAFADGGRVSLRWVLVHMVEEYARHNGHADLLREAIDGAVGE
ncbi:DinB family protein [Curtobacterium luteum]|uniref:DinB family protein n=1 Tax=Curtobacterium luteum TaxID=33881 RepID=UPI003803324E